MSEGFFLVKNKARSGITTMEEPLMPMTTVVDTNHCGTVTVVTDERGTRIEEPPNHTRPMQPHASYFVISAKGRNAKRAHEAAVDALKDGYCLGHVDKHSTITPRVCRALKRKSPV